MIPHPAYVSSIQYTKTKTKIKRKGHRYQLFSLGLGQSKKPFDLLFFIPFLLCNSISVLDSLTFDFIVLNSGFPDFRLI